LTCEGSKQGGRGKKKPSGQVARKESRARVPISGLYALAAPSTPDEVRHAMIDRAANGEALLIGKGQVFTFESKEF
jgi:hypothetical protein